MLGLVFSLIFSGLGCQRLSVGFLLDTLDKPLGSVGLRIGAAGADLGLEKFELLFCVAWLWLTIGYAHFGDIPR